MWLNLVLALYPDKWRDRYEDEFRAMLELCDLSLLDWLDMLISAIETRTGYTWRDIMKDLLNRLTGIIALLSALGFASALVIPVEETAEFMLIISPILSILLIPAMHRVLKIHKPKTSFVVMMTGIGAIVLLIANFIFAIVANAVGVREIFLPLITIISTISLILVGVWIISVNVLAMQTDMLPFLLGFIGILAGIGWIITMTTTMVTSFTDFTINASTVFKGIYLTAFGTLLLGYFIWSVGTGLYFVTGNVSRKLQLVY